MGERGFFGVAIYNFRHDVNIGGLLRSAYCFGAGWVATVGRRYSPQASDTPNTPKHVPLLSFSDVDDLADHLPHACQLVAVELAEGARDLRTFCHPERACYLLGSETGGLPEKVLRRCPIKVVIPGLAACLNVASTGSIVLYDRLTKRGGLPHTP